MGRIKPFDEEDMSNFAYDHEEDEEKSDEELLDEWETEGPEDDKSALPEDTALDAALGEEAALADDAVPDAGASEDDDAREDDDR
jgi:hypothetical protein